VSSRGPSRQHLSDRATKGIVAERLKVDMDTAFRMIRSYARNHHTLLSAAELDSPSKGRSAEPPGRPD
jgi:hypothetical protein